MLQTDGEYLIDNGTIEQKSLPESMSSIQDDEDRYKPEGHIELHIDKFSEFARGEGPNGGQRLSHPVFVRGLPWKILAIPRDSPQRHPNDRRLPHNALKGLGYFLQCNGESQDPSWNCTASATLQIKSHKQDQEDHSRKINHTFYAKENDWGFSHYLSCADLINPENGWVDENDTVTLIVDVSADAPHGVQWDSKKHAGFIGLKNQGATCYMNSILQTLFFTNKLRKAVYEMPTEEDEQENSVALAMQRVFFELQFSSVPVGTKKLTKSFGWDSIDSFLQHDVQELCRVLLDNLESKMKSTKVAQVAETIPSLFKGRTKSFIKCKEISFESSREESYYDIQLNVKGKSNLIESFRDYTAVEILDGENKYDAGENGLQPAEKGVKFLSFPPVLHLHLMRFQYDPALDSNVKINDKFEFPDELALNEFVDEDGEKDDFTFLLYAVLVHSGDFHGGHYVVYINTNLSTSTSQAPRTQQRWCKFDDDVVSRATYKDAVTSNYGGDDADAVGRSFTNAYMLVYVKKSAIDDVLPPMSENDIPNHLKERFETEKQREAQKKLEKEEANHYCNIILLTDEDLKSYRGFELFDQKILDSKSRHMKVEKAMKFPELYKFIAKNLGVNPDGIRLWDCIERAKQRYYAGYHMEFVRPCKLLKYSDDLDSSDDIEMNGSGYHYTSENVVSQDHVIYLEHGKYSKQEGKYVLPKLDLEHDNIFFVKYFNHERRLTEFKGICFDKFNKELSLIFPTLREVAGIQPDIPINVYLEIRPDNIQSLTSRPSIMSRELGDGAIIIVEESERVKECNITAQGYLKELLNRIEVEVHVNIGGFHNAVNQPLPPFKGQVGLEWTLQKLARWVGSRIDFDPVRILLWKVNQHTEKPVAAFDDHYTRFCVKELLSIQHHDPRISKCFKLFYTRLPVKVEELHFYRHLTVQLLVDKFQIKEVQILVEKDGTVGQILEEVKKQIPDSENENKQYRLLVVGTTPGFLRVLKILNNDAKYSAALGYSSPSLQFRVEEIPDDQQIVAPDEFLLPVAHFDKEPVRMFGVPFYIKIHNEEKISDIRRRIRQMMDVSEKEFEKYKFSIILQHRIVREFDNEDETQVVKISELANPAFTNYASTPFLGIDHMNKSRGLRGSHTAEKAIVIHN